MLVLSDHIHFIYVLFYFLSLFIFFIYFLDVITSNTVISRQKITISAGTPVRIFQNIWRYISAVSTVSFFLSVGNLRRYLTYFQDFVSFVLFHIFSFKLYLVIFWCQALFISRFIILDGSQWLFSFWDSFHLVLTFRSIKSKCIFLSLRSVILEGGWQVEDKTHVSTSSAGVMRGRNVRSTPAWTSGWRMTPAPRQRNTSRLITCVTV